MKVFRYLLSGVEHILEWAGSVMMFVSCMLMFVEVVLRYVFRVSHEWGDEVVLYLALFAALIFMGNALRGNRHISVGFIKESLKGKSRDLIVLINYIAVFVGCSAMTYFFLKYVGWLEAMNVRSPSTASIPMWMVLSSMIIGLGFTAIVSVEKIIDTVNKLRGKRPLTEEKAHAHH